MVMLQQEAGGIAVVNEGCFGTLLKPTSLFLTIEVENNLIDFELWRAEKANLVFIGEPSVRRLDPAVRE